MSVRKKKEESFDWTPLKKITAFLIMSIVTAIGTYFGFNPEEKPKEEVSKIETPNGVNFSGNGNTNLNNSTINNVNNNTNNINNTNTIIKKEVIQPTQIIQKEIIIEKENTDDFGSVGGEEFINKTEIRLRSINDYSINNKSNPVLLLEEDYPTLNLWKGQSLPLLISDNRLIFNHNNKVYKSPIINFIGNGTKIILIEE